MISRSAAVVIAASVTAALPARPAWAAERVSIVVVADAEDAMTRRIQAELANDGFVVASARSSPAGAMDESGAAIAAVLVVRPSHEVEVWMREPAGALTLHEIVGDAGVAEERDRTVGLRVVEIVRASLLDSAGRPRAAAPAPDLPPGVIRDPGVARQRALPRAPPVRRQPGPWPFGLEGSRWGFAAGAAFAFDPGGLRPGLALDLEASFVTARGLGVGLSADLPPQANEIGVQGALANVWLGVVTLAARAEWSPRASRWRAAGELGPGLVWLHAVGGAAPPLVGRSVGDVVFAPASRGVVGYELTRSFAFVSSFLVAVPVRDVRLVLPMQPTLATHVVLAPSVGFELMIDR